jgi:hypothetical protein
MENTMRNVEVKNENQSLEKTILLAEELRLNFLEEAQIFLSFWYKHTIEKLIDSYPPAAKKLTAEHIGHIKKELRDLQNNSKSELTKVLSKEEIWWHLGTLTDIPRDFYKTIDNLLDHDLRIVFGKVGLILEEYGFIKKNHFDGDKGFVAHKDDNNIYYFEYTYPVHWSDQMKRKMDNYWENYKFYLDRIKK